MAAVVGTPIEQPADGVDTSVGSGAFATITVPSTGGNRVLWVQVCWFDEGGGDLTAVTADGQSMTRDSEGLPGVGAISTEGRTELWMLIDPNTGSNSINLTFSQTVDECTVMAWVTDDTDQTTPYSETDTDGFASDTQATLTVTLTGDNILVGGVYAYFASAYTLSLSDNQITIDASGNDNSIKGSQWSSDGTMNFNFNQNADHLAAGVEVEDDPAGGATITGSGTPDAQNATVVGVGEREVPGSGTPQAQSATTVGVAEREIPGSGTPDAQNATTVGSGTVGNLAITSVGGDDVVQSGEQNVVMLGTGFAKA